MIVVALLKLVNHLVTGVYLRSEVDEDLIVRGLGEQMIEAEGTVVIVLIRAKFCHYELTIGVYLEFY